MMIQHFSVMNVLYIPEMGYFDKTFGMLSSDQLDMQQLQHCDNAFAGTIHSLLTVTSSDFNTYVAGSFNL